MLRLGLRNSISIETTLCKFKGFYETQYYYVQVDALRNVDFVSTVSGGSLIGVHFHLRMRKLLQSKNDEVMGIDC